MTKRAGDLKEPASVVTVPAPNAQELWQRYHHQVDDHAENELVIQYLPLVASTLARLSITLPEHVDRDDLNSAGLMGLLQALRNFDPSSGRPFEAYARLRVRGAMLDELRRMDWMPRSVHEKARKVQQAMAQVEQVQGKLAEDDQVAFELGISVGAYHRLLDEIRPAAFLCLDAVNATEDGDGGNLHEVVANTAAVNPVDQASDQELSRIILGHLKQMPETQRKVLAFYYLEDMNLREIAEVMRLTESRVCQIHAQAILSMQAHVRRLEKGAFRQSSLSLHAQP